VKNTFFIERFTKLSDFLRNIIFRVQLFVNHLTIKNNQRVDHNHLNQQNFWYSVCQVIMGERVTNGHYIDNFVVLAFDDFTTPFPLIVYKRKDAGIKGTATHSQQHASRLQQPTSIMS
jgi:hypothetical protein